MATGVARQAIEFGVDGLQQQIHRLHRLTHVKHVAFDALHACENRRLRSILVGRRRLFANGLFDSERKEISLEPISTSLPPRLLSLQFFDAHHHVDMSVRVLFEHIAYIVGFAGLLNEKNSSSSSK